MRAAVGLAPGPRRRRRGKRRSFPRGNERGGAYPRQRRRARRTLRSGRCGVADVDAFAGWGRHADPLFRHYNLPRARRRPRPTSCGAFSPERRDVAAALRRPGAASRVVAIAGDARHRSRGGQRRDRHPARPGFRRPGARPPHPGGPSRRFLPAKGSATSRLEVAGYNGRAIAAYRAGGFAVDDEYWADPEPGLDVRVVARGSGRRHRVGRTCASSPTGAIEVRIVRMERRLNPERNTERRSPHVTQPIDLIALDLDGTLARARRDDFAPPTARAIARALKSGIRVVLVTGRGVDTPIRGLARTGTQPAGDLLPRRIDERLRRRTRTSFTCPCRSSTPSRCSNSPKRTGVHVAVYAEEMFWRVTGLARLHAGHARSRLARGAYAARRAQGAARRRSFASSAAPRSRRCEREFGDLPLTFLLRNMARVSRVRRAESRRQQEERAGAAVRRFPDPERPRARRSATRATTCRCCSGPASASRWPTPRPRSGKRCATSPPTTISDGVAQAIERFCFSGGEEDGVMQPAAPTPEYEDALRDLLARRDWQGLREHSRTHNADSRRRLQSGSALLGGARCTS